MNKVVITAALRTPIGAFGGSLKDVSAVELGVQLVQALLHESKLEPHQVDEVIFGNVLSAGLGQNVSRQIALKAGLPAQVSAYSVNKLCGSGLKSVALGADAIRLSAAEIVICGGTESMSQAPYVQRNLRFGSKMGHVDLVDTLLSDGLVDAFHDVQMGVTAENIVERYAYDREGLDQFALNSQHKAAQAQRMGRFLDEIVPIQVHSKKGVLRVETDESIRPDSTLDALGKLRPAFKADGHVTPGNSSTINDGAAAVVLMSEAKALALGIPILAEIEAYASAGVDPLVMGTGPIPATQKALQRAGLSVDDLDLIEANEAFAAQAMCVIEDLALPLEKVNVNGGAIALGHPIGASGARVLVSLLHELNKRKARRGLATLCIGGGMGIAMIVKRP
jgi:acetyl-CoA C-acetyltransferase